ncbi:uncharacterized protein J8A68_004345 [[Candida] subhashii]|uniref:Uncharacterized protein n=1 Tax=[Candida] subhashii TaxID=561895 RepID=A0A8J5QH88_9ASCO|nr:uncharacterized protein J8A68_004345 [[Candida] subhashii]KAG7662083.1 hypothetical protein J8A68_004345 [[Candida] subhashii]
MSEKVLDISTLPKSVDRYPNPLANLTRGVGYPAWTPIDTKGETWRIFRFGFMTTATTYALAYFWRRVAFSLQQPAILVSMFTIVKGVRSSLANIREKNDIWNTFWAFGAANTAVMTVGFKNIPVKHRIMSAVGFTCLTSVIEATWYAQSTSSIGKNFTFKVANAEGDEKQEFWDVWMRRPLSATIEDLGVGRGILKP